MSGTTMLARVMMAVVVMAAAVAVMAAAVTAAQTSPKRESALAKPTLSGCRNRPKHYKFGTHHYFFSWQHPRSLPSRRYSWMEARNECRRRCMDLVSIETEVEFDMLAIILKGNHIGNVWTSGRLCNFPACDRRPELLPLHINGWFWASTLDRIPRTDRVAPAWSGIPWLNTTLSEGEVGPCMKLKVLRTKRGVRWQGMDCQVKMEFVCEDSEELLRYIESMHGFLKKRGSA